MKSSTSTPRPGALAVAAAVAGAALALSACSGSASSTVAVASTGPEATQPAQAGAACDKPGFGRHAALAVGSVQTYLWKPFSAGAFDAGAKGRTTAMRKGAGASALAARELAAAKPLVAGCSASIPLVNALTTGASLARAASAQLTAGKLNRETVAGVNSIGSTLVAQAAGNLGLTITPVVPTTAQLTTG